MTDEDKRDALAWLDGQIGAETVGGWASTRVLHHLRTIKAMLAEPRLPNIPSEEAIKAMAEVINMGMEFETGCRRAYRALHAHLSKPATKTVWRVMILKGDTMSMCNNAMDLETALEQARRAAEQGCGVTLNPHEVPA